MREQYWILAGLWWGLSACAFEAHSAAAPDPDPAATMPGGAELGSGPLHRTTHPDPAVEAAVVAWRWRHWTHGDVPSPDVEPCARRIGGLAVAILDDPWDFRRLCQRCNASDDDPSCDSLGRAHACAPWGDPESDDGVIGLPRALVVVDAARAEDPDVLDALVVHETIHHLGICTGAGADAVHGNDGWWCADESCVSGRARSR